MESSERLLRTLTRFAGQRMLVAGDVILDRYWWGDASRLSPEAPVPVVRRQRATVRPGGAANTAANLGALGASVEVFGVTGADREADDLRAVLAEGGIGVSGLLADHSRPTTSKTRVVAMHQQIVRVDDEHSAALSDDIAGRSAEAIRAALPSADALVLSDYAKGFLTPRLLRTIIDAAVSAGKPVFIDPKGDDAARYRGATLLKPNRLELGILTGTRVRSHDDTLGAGCRLCDFLPGTDIVVTQGPEGMTRFRDGQILEHVTPAPRQVYDVTGAGDTVLAVLAMAVTAGAGWRDAMQLAAEAAAIAIGTMGTAAITRAQLEAAVSEPGRPAGV